MRCNEKRRYLTRKEAKKSKQFQEKKSGLHLYLYKCPECKFLHLTKNRLGNKVWSNSLDNRI